MVDAPPPNTARMGSSNAATAPASPTTQDKGLKKGVVGFWEGLAIGLDSTAPAYLLAAALGTMVLLAGVKAPAVLWISFVPMFLIAGAFYYMNRADQDCGTTFSWVTRTMGPWIGWMGGWAVFTTGVVVIGAQADVAAYYLYDILGLDALRDSRVAVVALTVAIIVIMTWLCVLGTQLSARLQLVLVFFQIGALLLFAATTIGAMISGNAAADAPAFSWDWFNPVGLSGSALIAGMLLGVFLYWGWESAVNLNEESENADTAPGRAGVISTVLLVLTYLTVAVGVIGTTGMSTFEEYDDDAGLFGAVADQFMGPFAFLAVISIITSGLASTQTTILPASRASLSMAMAGAFPRVFGRVDTKRGTPAAGTWIIGITAVAWYVGASIVSENFLFDSLSALSIIVAFYYALTGLACAVYWRKELRRSLKAFLLIGVGPVTGAAVLLFLLYQCIVDMADPAVSYTGTEVLGLGVPLVIAIALFVLGLVLMVIFWAVRRTSYFSRRGGETVSDEVALAALGPVAPSIDSNRT